MQKWSEIITKGLSHAAIYMAQIYFAPPTPFQMVKNVFFELTQIKFYK